MTTKFSKSQIFQSAWNTAREMARAAGTGPRAQFAAALRQTYSMVREIEAGEAAQAELATARRIEIEAEIESLQASLRQGGVRRSADKDAKRARIAALELALAA